MVKQELEELLVDLKKDIDDTIMRGITFKNLCSLTDRISDMKLIKWYEEHCDKDGDWLTKRIEGEFHAAEEYYAEWQRTKQDKYRQIAKDEARHLEMILQDAQQQGMNEAQIGQFRKKLQGLTAKLG